MAAQLRGSPDGAGQGIGEVLKNLVRNGPEVKEEQPKKLVLVNKAGESRSPYVRAHSSNPVAWQIWGDEAIALARKENKLLFVSIGYSACHCKGASSQVD